jgi:hypothetical protein
MFAALANCQRLKHETNRVYSYHSCMNMLEREIRTVCHYCKQEIAAQRLYKAKTFQAPEAWRLYL